MYELNEAKLRELLADAKKPVVPIDRYESSADDLHRLIDTLVDEGAIRTEASRACLAIYSKSLADPEPLVAVNPGSGPGVLGGAVYLAAEETDPIDYTVRVVRGICEKADELYEQSGAAVLDAIGQQLDGIEWGPDTSEAIAAIVRATGRQIRDPEEVEPPEREPCD